MCVVNVFQAAHYFGFKLVHVPVDQKTWMCDMRVNTLLNATQNVSVINVLLNFVNF